MLGRVQIRVATVVLLVVAAASRSAHARPRMEIGGYAGATSTTIHQSLECSRPPDPVRPCATSAEPSEGAHGVAAGAYLRYSLLPPIALEADVVYAQKGYGGDNPVRMHYLELPILVRVDPFGATGPARPFAVVGIAPAFQLGCHESGIRFDNDAHQPVPYSDACGSWPFLPRAPDRFDLGAVVGGGLGWELSFGVVEVQARYEEGLVDNGAWGTSGKTVNRAFYVLVGYGRTAGGR